MGSCWLAWPRLAHQRKKEQTTGEREGLTECNAWETQRNREAQSGGRGGKIKKGQTQKRDERNIYSGLITHKSIDWCVESRWGLSWHGQVRRGSLNIHDAGRSLLVLGCWGRFTSSWRLLEKQAKIAAPPFTLQHSASLHVCWGTSAVRVVLLMSRERRVSKAGGGSPLWAWLSCMCRGKSPGSALKLSRHLTGLSVKIGGKSDSKREGKRQRKRVLQRQTE